MGNCCTISPPKVAYSHVEEGDLALTSISRTFGGTTPSAAIQERSQQELQYLKTNAHNIGSGASDGIYVIAYYPIRSGTIEDRTLRAVRWPPGYRMPQYKIVIGITSSRRAIWPGREVVELTVYPVGLTWQSIGRIYEANKSNSPGLLKLYNSAEIDYEAGIGDVRTLARMYAFKLYAKDPTNNEVSGWTGPNTRFEPLKKISA